MKKRTHWETRHLHQHLMRRSNTPFLWGTNDCATFVADSIKAVTGIDIADDFRGKYDTEFGALRTIKEVTGGSTIEDAVVYCADKYGLQEWRYPLMAQRGDMVLVTDSGRSITGIVHLSGRHVVAVGEEGLKRIPLLNITRAWKV